MFRLGVATCAVVALMYVTFAPQQSSQFFVPAPLPTQTMQPYVSAGAQYDMTMTMPMQAEPYLEPIVEMPVYMPQEEEASWDGLIGWGLMGLGFGSVAMLAMQGQRSEPEEPLSRSTDIQMQSAATDWGMKEISPDGKLVQRIEGTTRKTWKFNDLSKDRVQLALTSEGRPINSEVQLWLGPDWTPFTMKAYSEDGKLRPIQTLVGTRNKSAMIEVRNVGSDTFPFSAASNYAKGAMVALPTELPAAIEGERCDGGALRSYPIDAASDQVEVVLNTDGKQLNARVELLNAPNNPKQTFECFTNNGELNSLVVCFNLPDQGNTIRVVNLAPVEFPCYIHLNEKQL